MATTVRVSWIDSVSPGVISTTIYRDDIEIGSVGNGVQVFDDVTALEGITYKYEVQAKTASGESTDEVIGVNVENITTSSPVTNVYPQDNAASDNPEVDAIGPWTYSTGAVSSSVDGIDTPAHDGLYCIKVETTTAGTGKIGGALFTVESGATYDIDIWAKRGTSNTDSRFSTWFGVVTSPDISIVDQTWTKYSMTVTTSGTSIYINVYPERGTSVIGDSCYIDLITMTKI